MRAGWVVVTALVVAPLGCENRPKAPALTTEAVDDTPEQTQRRDKASPTMLRLHPNSPAGSTM